LILVALIGVGGCDQGGGKSSQDMRPAHGDLGILSCAGVVDCFDACPQNDDSCFFDCFSAGSDHAQELLNDALFTCPATKLCGGRSDAGAAQCTSNDTPDSASQACVDCINHLDTTLEKSTCKTEFDACLDDK
jgi:hypothetical protein